MLFERRNLSVLITQGSFWSMLLISPSKGFWTRKALVQWLQARKLCSWGLWSFPV